MTVRQVDAEDTERVLELRLFALQNAPEAFGMDYATELQSPVEAWRTRCTPTDTSAIFVAEDAGKFVGMAGIRSDGRVKTGHVGFLWGVFVHPDAREQGVAKALVQACLTWAREQRLVRVNLSVVTTNVVAIRVYVGCGFSVYGVEPDVSRVLGKSYDELLMHCWL